MGGSGGGSGSSNALSQRSDVDLLKTVGARAKTEQAKRKAIERGHKQTGRGKSLGRSGRKGLVSTGVEELLCAPPLHSQAHAINDQ